MPVRAPVVIAVVALLALFASVSPAAAGADDPDPLSLLPGRGFTEAIGLGDDVVAVYVCNTTGLRDNSFTLQDIVDWGNDDIAPFFDLISRGRYSVTFVAGGEVNVNASGTAADTPCLNAAFDQATTHPNLMVMSRALGGGGLGTAGTLFWDGTSISGPTLQDSSNESGRGFLVRGGTPAGSWELPMTVAHEIGHTLGWPHSGSASDGSSAEYDNQVDLMSGGGWDPGNVHVDWDNGCTFGISTVGACQIVHTLAINRYASGWVDLDQIVPVARDGVAVELVGSEAASGNALAIVPTADPLVYLTVEAKPASGYDAVMPVSGVVVHQIDLTEPCGAPQHFCVATSRRQQAAVPAAADEDSANHVVAVGESLAVPGTGVTVEVVSASADGFNVEFSGDPVGCAMGPNPFTDITEASYAFASVGCIRVLGITTGTSASTYSPGATVTREQMVAFLGRLYRAIGQTCSYPAIPFVDIGAGSYAYNDLACLWNLEVVNGTSDTEFSPGGYVNREQMAAFLARLWRELGNTCSTAATPFVDIDGSFAKNDIVCIYHIGVTTGTGDGTTYSPDQFVTREQMAAFLARFWEAAT